MLDCQNTEFIVTSAKEVMSLADCICLFAKVVNRFLIKFYEMTINGTRTDDYILAVIRITV